MTKYLVKVISIATDENPSFPGQEAIAFYGKKERMIGYFGSHPEATHMKLDIHPYMVREYGYNRLCDAKRNWSYRNPENTAYWRSTAEIITVEI